MKFARVTENSPQRLRRGEGTKTILGTPSSFLLERRVPAQKHQQGRNLQLVRSYSDPSLRFGISENSLRGRCFLPLRLEDRKHRALGISQDGPCTHTSHGGGRHDGLASELRGFCSGGNGITNQEIEEPVRRHF